MVEIIDDFCPKEYFENLQEIIMEPASRFPWFYHNRINGELYDDSKDVFQFVHLLYPCAVGTTQDKYMKCLQPVINSMGAHAILRVKANCIPRTEEIVEHGYHTDFVENNEGITTAILYINTNNGYTIFKEGTMVASKANRLVIFPCNYLHAGTSCTDQNIRVLINFNFVKLPTPFT